MDQKEFLLYSLKSTIVPSTGCTEPVAIALCSAVARSKAPGTVKKIEIVLDLGLFKNAMGVGIPGLDRRGVPLCCAIGLVDGDPENGMDILGKIKTLHKNEIEKTASMVEVSVREDIPTLFIQVTLTTDASCVRVITTDRHDHIASIQTPPFTEYQLSADVSAAPEIQNYTLQDIVEFVDKMPVEQFAFLWDGVEMNRKMSKAGMEKGFLKDIAPLDSEHNLLPLTQRMTGAASYARMSGIMLPTMTATGSGNQGITVFLTVDTVCQSYHIGYERELRALALANLINVFAKSYMGSLSPICACGVASGLGASIGIVYALGGTEVQMLGAMKNMLGGVSGMICDGAKEGCANKVAIGAGCALISALTALQGQQLSADNGILADNMTTLYEHLSTLIHNGMTNMNRTIVDIMLADC